MNFIDIIIIGFALSMDACTVAMSDGLIDNRVTKKKLIFICIIFGIFQALMPLIAYFSCSFFSNIISTIAPYVALVLLGFIGIHMIYQYICTKNNNDKVLLTKNLSYKEIIIQALATSIDAFAVGISLLASDKAGLLDINIFIAVIIIGLITFLLSLFSILIGKKFSKIFTNKAQLVGGIVLCILALKIFFDGIIH